MDITTISALLVALIPSVITLVKYLIERHDGKKKDSLEEFKDIYEKNRTEDLINQYRTQIVLFYLIFKDKKTMTRNDYSQLEDLYKKYIELGGNSYVKSLMD